MSQNALAILASVFSAGLKIWTSFKIPGTNSTPLQYVIFITVAIMILRLVVSLISGSSSPNHPF